MTVQEIIQRSIDMHPSLLREALLNVAALHSRAGNEMLDKKASESAYRLADSCRSAAAALGNDNPLAVIMGDMSAWTSTLRQAAKLQCLPRHMVPAAVAAYEAAH
jgi:hypothetical protein